MTILQDQTKPSHEELLAMIAKLKAENDKLKTNGHGLKVSTKGAVSLYGLGRFPVTLYQQQWAKLFAMQPMVEQFIAAHKAELSVKE
jgi:hypothetical protein